MIVEHRVTIRHEHDEVDNIEVLCMGEWAWFERKRTCRIVPKPSDSDFVNDWHYLCSECGCEIPVYGRNPNNYKVIIDHANYCPTCGARVVEE